MGILPYKVLCNAALCVFHVSLLKVALSKVLDPNIEMNRRSRPVLICLDNKLETKQRFYGNMPCHISIL